MDEELIQSVLNTIPDQVKYLSESGDENVSILDLIYSLGATSVALMDVDISYTTDREQCEILLRYLESIDYEMDTALETDDNVTVALDFILNQGAVMRGRRSEVITFMELVYRLKVTPADVNVAFDIFSLSNLEQCRLVERYAKSKYYIGGDSK